MILVDEDDTEYTEPYVTVYDNSTILKPLESPFHRKLKHRRIRMTKPRSLRGQYYVVEVKRVEQSRLVPLSSIDERLEIRVCHDPRYYKFGV